MITQIFSFKILQNIQVEQSLLFLLPIKILNVSIQMITTKVLNKKLQSYIRQKMSQNCIEYQDYKRIIEQQASTPRRNIFEQNRILTNQLEKLSQENNKINHQLTQLKNICLAIIDAIGRVFSQELAHQLQQILNNCQDQIQNIQLMSETIFQVLVTHQSQLTVSDWSQSRTSRRKQLRTPERIQQFNNKQIFPYRQQSFREQNKISPVLTSRKHQSSSRSPNSMATSRKNNDPSTNKSYCQQNNNNMHTIIATGISCEVCQQTFGPNQFIEHASRCKQDKQESLGTVHINQSFNSEQESSLNSNILKIQQNQMQSLKQLKQLNDIDLQDTHDRRLKKQSDSYMKMMKSLIMMQNQIQEQIQLIKCSKQRIDRDAQKRKLQKDLAKVMYVIQQKKKQVKQKQNEKNSKLNNNSSKCNKFKKNSIQRNKN